MVLAETVKGMPVVYPCSVPGCRLVARRGEGRCAEHRRSVVVPYGHAWAIRAALFRQRYPLCGDRPHGQPPVLSACYVATPRRLSPAECVDHVRPHGGDPGLFWDEAANWQSLCLACHAAKTRAGL
jgi:5-methylcytosine-specific restriction protein A